MPIYTYLCRECKEKTEELQGMKDPPPEECPNCKKKGSLDKIMGVSNFQLVGSGWAKDGYS